MASINVHLRCGVLCMVLFVMVMQPKYYSAAAVVTADAPAPETEPETGTGKDGCSIFGGEVACEGGSIPYGSAFFANLGTTLHQLVENTAYANFCFKTQNGGCHSPAYGEASCDESVLASPEECTKCLFHLSYYILGICRGSLSGRIKYGGCYLRYDNNRF